MGFNIEHGMVKSIAELGKLAGESVQSSRQQELMLGLSQSIRSEANQREMAQFQTMMQMESQKRQMTWDMEKIQLVQQNDFQNKLEIYNMEQQRQYQEQARKQSELDATLDAIEKSEIMTPDEKERLKLDVTSKSKIGRSAPETYIDPSKVAGQQGKVMRQLEDDLFAYQDLINNFAENKNVTGWGEGVVPLTKKDDDGNVVEATPQERAMYDYAKYRSAQNLQALNPMPGAVPGGSANDVLDILGK